MTSAKERFTQHCISRLDYDVGDMIYYKYEDIHNNKILHEVGLVLDIYLHSKHQYLVTKFLNPKEEIIVVFSDSLKKYYGQIV